MQEKQEDKRINIEWLEKRKKNADNHLGDLHRAALCINLPVDERRFEYGLCFYQGYDKDDLDWDNTVLPDVKKKREFIWDVIPLAIKFPPNATKESDAEFIYLVTQFDCSNRSFLGSVCYITSRTGRIKEKWFVGKARANAENKIKPLRQSHFKTLNMLLYNEFFFDFWNQSLVPIWRRSLSNEFYYLGINASTMHTREAKSVYSKSLDCLMNTPVKDAVLLLLACNAFSILQPFFKTYPQVKKSDDLAKQIKAIDQQFAWMIVGSNNELISLLQNLLCGPENQHSLTMAGIRIVDDTHMPKKISNKRLESVRRQSPCSIWMHSIITAEFISENKLLPIILLGTEAVSWDPSPLKAIEPFLEQLLYNFVGGFEKDAHEKNVAQQSKTDDTVLDIFSKLRDDLKDFASKYYYECEFSSVHFKRRSKDDTRYYCIEELASVEVYEQTCIPAIQEMKEDEFQSYQEALSGAYDPDGFDDTQWIAERIEVRKLCNRAKRQIRKAYQAKGNQVTNLDAIFLAERERLRIDTAMSPLALNKSAYLSASFKKLVAYCDLPTEYMAMLDEALQNLFTIATKTTPQMELESYLNWLIRQGHYARIRGKNSACDTIKVWYDPKANQFYLPRPAYWGDLIGKVFSESQMRWEASLKDLLFTVKRGNQKRRTHEVVLRAGGASEFAICIQGSKLSKQFWDEDVVQNMKQFLQADPTPMRRGSK